MRSYLKALIFDLDGTLADTVPAITEAVNMTLKTLNLPEHTENEIKGFIGQGPKHLISESIPKEIRLNDPTIVDRALKLYNENYAKTYMHTQKLYDGIEETLVGLSKHYKIAVLSNKQDIYVKNMIKQLLPEGICEIACGTVDGIPAKPDPTIALKIVEHLGFEPHQCMLIGDSDIDILTAENAGLDILSVSWGYCSKEKLINKGAQDIICSQYELAEYFYY